MSKPEYLKFRCCMCPNTKRPELTICPGIPGSLHPEESRCRFVKGYRDKRGWEYQVMVGLNLDYRPHYLKPGGEWREMANLPSCLWFDQAQSDLNRHAAARGWDEI